MSMYRILRILLIILNAFLGVTAVLGGIGLLTGVVAPPLEMLEGSIFSSYVIPGLALLVIVGGSALVAMRMVLRNDPRGALASAGAGAAIMAFEVVEVMVIGSDTGVARDLQLFYFGLGMLIVVVAMFLRISEFRVKPGNRSK
jgi:hypothetical protein